MSRPFIKGGTPVGSESLCKTCSNAQIMTGYRESELLTICDNVHPNLVVPFSMSECTSYYDRNRPSWDDMQKFALHISTEKPRGFKVGAGFGETTVKVTPACNDDEEDD